MGSISCHITPLVINSPGSGHTHTQTHTHTDDPHRINLKKPGACRPQASACLAIPHWPILILSHLVVHHHWTNLRTVKILCREIHLSLPFLDMYIAICFSSGAALHSRCTHVFHSLQVSLLALTSFGSLTLINMDGSYHFALRTMRPDEVIWLDSSYI